nr:hypothetical protein [uncultured Methanoregula sp.]
MNLPGKIPLALVLMSLLFFFPTIAPLTDSVLRDLGVPSAMNIPVSSAIWNHYLLGLISLCGGIAFLAVTRKGNPTWYLGIPLVLAFAVIVVAPFAGALFVIHDPSPPLYHPGVMLSLLAGYGLFLLPPCAALFFWSQRRLGRWVPVMTGIALVITLNALIFAFYLFSPYLVAAGFLPPAEPQYIDGHLVKMADGEGILFLFLHYMIGLPLLGICFLALAALFWHAARGTDPAPPPASGATP